jgi:hypothetical protein
MLWTKLRCIEYDGSPFDSNDEIVSILADVEHNRWNVEELSKLLHNCILICLSVEFNMLIL